MRSPGRLSYATDYAANRKVSRKFEKAVIRVNEDLRRIEDFPPAVPRSKP